MSLRLRLREFSRHLYARFFGAFAINKAIDKAELLLCTELGFPLLNIRCRKCEYVLHYTKNSTGIAVVVYGANFYPHAYRVSSSPPSPRNIILRDETKDTRPIGRVHIYEDKSTSVVFYGAIEEAHSLHVGQGRSAEHVVAAAPVVQVSDKYLDEMLEKVEHQDPIRDPEQYIRTIDGSGVRYIPILTYTGNGHVHK